MIWFKKNTGGQFTANVSIIDISYRLQKSLIWQLTVNIGKVDVLSVS